MKKLVLAAALLSPSAAFADFIGVHAGISQWKSEFEGKIAGVEKYNQRQEFGWGVPDFEERGFDGEKNTFAFIALEHPIPLLPNFRIDYTDISERKVSPSEIPANRIMVNGFIVDLSQHVQTELNINAFDAIVYYELLDNWVNLDLGLNIRKMSGEFVESTFAEPVPPFLLNGSNDCGNFIRTGNYCALPPQSEVTDFDFVVPLLFGTVRFDMPLSGAYAESTFKWIKYDGNTISDLQAEIGYMLDLPLGEIGLGLGYRRSSMIADDLQGLFADAKLDGYYAGLKFHF